MAKHEKLLDDLSKNLSQIINENPTNAQIASCIQRCLLINKGGFTGTYGVIGYAELDIFLYPINVYDNKTLKIYVLNLIKRCSGKKEIWTAS